MSSSNRLPKWATYHPYSSSQETSISNKPSNNASAAPSSSSAVKIQNEHKILIQNDELILRTKAYHFTCTDIIQRTFDEMLCQQIHKNILSPLCNFMTQFQPLSIDTDCNNEQKFECSDSTPRKRRRVEKQSKVKDEFYNQILYQTMEQKNYNPTLLPIGIVHVQPSVLDRHVIIHALKRQLISSSTIESCVYNPAVCLLSDMDMSSYGLINVNRNFKKNKVEYLLFSILSQVRFLSPSLPLSLSFISKSIFFCLMLKLYLASFIFHYHDTCSVSNKEVIQISLLNYCNHCHLLYLHLVQSLIKYFYGHKTQQILILY